MEHAADIAQVLDISPHALVAKRVDGGSTKSAKFILGDGTDQQWFAKLVDPVREPTEKLVLRIEADHYETLGRLGLAGSIYPAFHKTVDTPQTTAVLVDYMPGMSWGGPWTSDNIQKVNQAMTAVHAVDVPMDIAQHVRAQHRRLCATLLAENKGVMNSGKEALLFEKAWDPESWAVHNSRGQTVFKGSKELHDRILWMRSRYNLTQGKQLAITDLTYGNIGLSNSQACFVDPAYLNIGRSSFDRAAAGINMLRLVPQHGPGARVRDLIKDSFVYDPVALAAWTTYWVASLQLPYKSPDGGSIPWLDFQQDMAVTALDLWSEYIDQDERSSA